MAGILLPLDIRENKLWEPERPRTKFEAWIDLSLMAQTETITSERKLAERWKWPKSNVRRFIAELRIVDHLLDQKRTGVNLTELELLGFSRTKNGPQNGPPKKTTASNSNYSPEFDSWYSSWPRPQAKQDSFKNFEKRRKEHGLDFILQCSKNYLASLSPVKMGYAYASNNFFGEKSYYLEYIKPNEMPQKPQHGPRLFDELGDPIPGAKDRTPL